MYLIDVDDQMRESESIRHLLTSPLHREHLLGPMGVGSLCWIVMEVDNIHLVSSIVGEVDIIAGPLEFREPEVFERALKGQEAKYPDRHPSWHETLAAMEVAEAGGILWPPSPAYVVGVEVKCAYFSDRLHAVKDSRAQVRGIRKQVKRLATIGMDRLALLDVIANPPSAGENSGAWVKAAGRALGSLSKMKHILAARLPRETVAGQFVWSVGPVVGGDESARGAGVPMMLRPCVENLSLRAPDAGLAANRKALLEGISGILAAFARPRFFPAIFAGCRACKAIRPFDEIACRCAAKS
jgi:hypothetical protein